MDYIGLPKIEARMPFLVLQLSTVVSGDLNLTVSDLQLIVFYLATRPPDRQRVPNDTPRDLEKKESSRQDRTRGSLERDARTKARLQP